jgi:hypothetical protein
MKRRMRTFACPHCGHAVQLGALSCPGCGSDAQSGWSEEADAWSGDLPVGYGEDSGEEDEEEDDYQDFLRREGLAEDNRPAKAVLHRQRVVAVIVFLVICILLWQTLR